MVRRCCFWMLLIAAERPGWRRKLRHGCGKNLLLWQLGIRGRTAIIKRKLLQCNDFVLGGPRRCRPASPAALG
jgi:hypothetical protein